jgi:hypothetical protein
MRQKADRAAFYSRFHDALIRVYDQADNVIETQEHAGEFNVNRPTGQGAKNRLRDTEQL